MQLQHLARSRVLPGVKCCVAAALCHSAAVAIAPLTLQCAALADIDICSSKIIVVIFCYCRHLFLCTTPACPVSSILSLTDEQVCAPQPIWSAYRAAAYGSGLLTIYDTTSANWKWNGFIRNNVNPTGYYTDGTAEVRPASKPGPLPDINTVIKDRDMSPSARSVCSFCHANCIDVDAAHDLADTCSCVSEPATSLCERGVTLAKVPRNVDVSGLQMFTSETVNMTRCDRTPISATVPAK